MKESYIWLVTFVTHNSRISGRMIVYDIKVGEPYIFTSAQQIIVLEKIFEICQRHQIYVLACNVLPDHVHILVLAKTYRELQSYIGKIKGYSSYALNKLYDQKEQIWAQKFHFKSVQEENLITAFEYIAFNHLKHVERWGNHLLDTWQNSLKPIVDRNCTPLEEAQQILAQY